MFKNEFDVVINSNLSVVETVENLRKIGINIDKAKLKWVYDAISDDPIGSITIYRGKGFMPIIIPRFTKNGFVHYILNGRHTFM